MPPAARTPSKTARCAGAAERRRRRWRRRRRARSRWGTAGATGAAGARRRRWGRAGPGRAATAAGLLERRLGHRLGVGPVSVPLGGAEPPSSLASRAAIRAARATSACTCSTSTPIQPATVRVYSGRIELSRIVATIGAAARMPCTRPSAVDRSKRLIVVRTANSNIGTASSMRWRTASSPLASRRSQGSMPCSATATKDCDAQRWSSPKARMAAFCPAASPSKVKMTRAGARSASSRMIRRSTLMWSMPKAVPHVATAPSMPARWQAMTSV